MNKFVYLALTPAIVSSLIHGAAAPGAEQHLITREYAERTQRAVHMPDGRLFCEIPCQGGNIQDVHVSSDDKVVTFTLARSKYKNSFWARVLYGVGFCSCPDCKDRDGRMKIENGESCACVAVSCPLWFIPALILKSCRVCGGEPCCDRSREWVDIIHVKYQKNETLLPGFHINFNECFNGKILCDALQYRSLDFVNELLANGISSNSRNEDGEPALIVAVRYGKMDVVDALLAHHVDINAKNLEGKTALTIACDNNNQNMVNKLIAHGATVRAADPGENIV